MTKTVNSATTPYAAPADVANYADWVPLARLCVDDPVGSQAQPTLTQFLALSRVAALLQAASGEIEAACERGERYSTADLQALLGPPLTNGGALLKQLCVGLFAWECYKARSALQQVPDVAKEARAMLQALASGEEIFGFLETEAAGIADVEKEDPQDVINREGVVYQARAYWGCRARDRKQLW